PGRRAEPPSRADGRAHPALARPAHRLLLPVDAARALAAVLRVRLLEGPRDPEARRTGLVAARGPGRARRGTRWGGGRGARAHAPSGRARGRRRVRTVRDVGRHRARAGGVAVARAADRSGDRDAPRRLRDGLLERARRVRAPAETGAPGG